MASKTEKIDKEHELAIKAFLTAHVFHKQPELPPVTGVTLLRHGLIKDAAPATEDRYVLDVITREDHPDRINIPPGPLVAHFLKGDQKNGSIIEVAPLLLGRDRTGRAHAIQFFKNLFRRLKVRSGARLEDSFLRYEPLVLSDDVKTWTESATALFEAVSNDIELTLAGFQQSLKLNYSEGMNAYFAKLLNPNVHSLTALDLGPLMWAQGSTDVTNFIKKIGEDAKSLTEVFNQYYEQLGFVPLGAPFSLGKIIEGWLSMGRSVDNIWNESWAWAEEKQSPVARYHVCQLFCYHPKLIPKDQVSHFWTEILKVVLSSKSQHEGQEWLEEWRVRNELAQYYLKHFESRRPERNTIGTAILSWWLAEQVSAAFGRRGSLIRSIRESGIKSALANANFAWQTVVPAVGEPSTLRLATLFVSSMWSLALECELAHALKELGDSSLTSVLRDQLVLAVAESSSFWFSPQEKNGEGIFFAFDNGIAETGLALAKFIGHTSEKSDFESLLGKRQQLLDIPGIIANLSNILKLDPGEQALTAYALRCRTYLKQISPEEIWKVASGEEWFEPVFLQLDEAILQTLFDSLNVAFSAGPNTCRCGFPHLLAATAEAAHASLTRQRLLFLFTILASVAGDTVSAVERLFKGECRKTFTEEALFWYGQFSRIMQVSPPWAAGRIRPILLALSVP